MNCNLYSGISEPGLKSKTFQFLGLHVHAKADAGNWKFGSSPRHKRSWPSPAFTEALRSPLHRSRRVEQYSSGGSDARRGSSHQCRRCAAARHRAGKLSMLRRPERNAAHRLRSCVLFTSSNDPQTSPQASAAPQTGRDQPISSFRVSSFQTRYSAMRIGPLLITRVSEFPVSRIQGVRNLKDGVLCLRNRLVCEASTVLALLSFQGCQPEAGKVMRFQAVRQIPECTHFPSSKMPNSQLLFGSEHFAGNTREFPFADSGGGCGAFLLEFAGNFRRPVSSLDSVRELETPPTTPCPE